MNCEKLNEKNTEIIVIFIFNVPCIARTWAIMALGPCESPQCFSPYHPIKLLLLPSILINWLGRLLALHSTQLVLWVLTYFIMCPRNSLWFFFPNCKSHSFRYSHSSPILSLVFSASSCKTTFLSLQVPFFIWKKIVRQLWPYRRIDILKHNSSTLFVFNDIFLSLNFLFNPWMAIFTNQMGLPISLSHFLSFVMILPK